MYIGTGDEARRDTFANQKLICNSNTKCVAMFCTTGSTWPQENTTIDCSFYSGPTPVSVVRDSVKYKYNATYVKQ
jgi:hypothetical protein